MLDFWPACGWRHLRLDNNGQLRPGAAWFGHWLNRPELALVAESCAGEIKLHRALRADPLMVASGAALEAALAAISDADVRQNYRQFLALRDGVLAAGTLEAFYSGLFRTGAITLPPLFIDLIVQDLLRQWLDDGADALQARAAELLFRPQRISLAGGRLLAADRATADRLTDGAGFGALGRLLADAQVPLRSAQLAVLTDDNAVAYWTDGNGGQAGQGNPHADTGHRFVLDLTHSVAKTLAPGVAVPLALARSGQTALARVLERWILQLLGVAVRITPLARIDDAQWRWHVGMDAESSAILNDLYNGVTVDADRLARLVGLFRLDFHNPADMRADLGRAPVWLGLAMDAGGVLRLKPQNLLLNLPVAQLQ